MMHTARALVLRKWNRCDEEKEQMSSTQTTLVLSATTQNPNITLALSAKSQCPNHRSCHRDAVL